MIVVIQCAGAKQQGTGYFRTKSGEQIMFVSRPDAAPASKEFVYAHPDGPSEVPGKTWRELVLNYCKTRTSNPLGLLPAYKLYTRDAYEILVNKFGIDKVFILSAGWGLVRSDFFLPQYDITFSNNIDRHVKRKRHDYFADWCQIDPNIREPVIFFGGTSYVPTFVHLTRSLRSERIIFYNTQARIIASGCSLRRYDTSVRTNWHYLCAVDFAEGRITA